jgi:hypothetical protein
LTKTPKTYIGNSVFKNGEGKTWYPHVED